MGRAQLLDKILGSGPEGLLDHLLYVVNLFEVHVGIIFISHCTENYDMYLNLS